MPEPQASKISQVEVPPPAEFSGSEDKRAQAEEAAVASDESPPSWEEWARGQQTQRRENFRDTLSRIARGSAWIVAALLLATIGIWLFHMLAPQRWRWLADVEVRQIQTILFSGAVSAFATGVARNVIQREK